jgi:hypothetical protein
MGRLKAQVARSIACVCVCCLQRGRLLARGTRKKLESAVVLASTSFFISLCLVSRRNPVCGLFRYLCPGCCVLGVAWPLAVGSRVGVGVGVGANSRLAAGCRLARCSRVSGL